jgi:hypothetical protein
VIVSADYRLKPVLGYSNESLFFIENQPPALMEMFKEYDKQILYLKSVKQKIDKNKEWEELLECKTKTAKIKSIGPLLTTNWGQGCYYNDSCPEDTWTSLCQHTLVGCVAVAMGQVMKFHNHPATGIGNHFYIDDEFGLLEADFGNANYNWSEMPVQLFSSSSPIEVASTAQLLYHCGVSVTMNYGSSCSSAFAYKVANALDNHFHYSSEMRYYAKDDFTDAEWNIMLISNLDNSCPVIYFGGNHAFVCDGYDIQNYYHFNWGWEGYFNGFFFLNALTPGSHNFTSCQEIVFNILE